MTLCYNKLVTSGIEWRHRSGSVRGSLSVMPVVHPSVRLVVVVRLRWAERWPAVSRRRETTGIPQVVKRVVVVGACVACCCDVTRAQAEAGVGRQRGRAAPDWTDVAPGAGAACDSGRASWRQRRLPDASVAAGGADARPSVAAGRWHVPQSVLWQHRVKEWPFLIYKANIDLMQTMIVHKYRCT